MAQSSAAVLSKGPRIQIAKGLMTVLVSSIVLFALSFVAAPSSVMPSTIQSMLPFAAILAIIGLGQMLTIQQAGIDLSVPGAVSLAIVIVSHEPNGDNSKLLPAIFLAIAFAIGAGLINGYLIGFLNLNPIIATLGTNALLYGAVLGISQGIPRTTTSLLYSVCNGVTLGIPHAIYFALGALLAVVLMLRKTVAGRRFESIGASAPVARISGLRVKTHQGLAYVWAQLFYCLAGILLAGITNQPTAFMGDQYMLPSVAVVVLGGTSLLGGRGLPSATVIAALFLTQLDQFVLALGVNFAVRTLVQAAALAIGVAIYTVDWARLRSVLKELLSGQNRRVKTSLPSA
ncbi:MAG: hypothetical protein RLZZ626_645 [Actinomycetota bacterium]